MALSLRFMSSSKDEEEPIATPKEMYLKTVSCWKSLAAILLVSLLAAPEARSQGAALSGLWSGGGIVVYPSGTRERARCRVHYSAESESHVAVNASCATASGTVSQNARLRKTGANSYSGSFFNSQYNFTGSISVVVHGNSQNVTLRSSSGTASLTLVR